MPSLSSPIESEVRIRRAARSDVPKLAPVFEQYRAFYGAAPSAEDAARFIDERLARGESALFVAMQGEHPPEVVGFVQLYPSFSSLAMRSTAILNDLFVVPNRRRMGIARRLMATALEHARSCGASSVELATHHTNASAQALYREFGFREDTEFARLSVVLRGASGIRTSVANTIDSRVAPPASQ
jgi:ribosomal protein S18 acetylase RimI-like enzyme